MTDDALASVLDHYGIHHRDVGGFQKILCPVHDEHRPSCSVSLSTGYFECHSCGARGGVLDIIIAREGVEREAATKLCEGITGARYRDVRSGNAEQPSGRVRSGEGFRPRYGARSSAGVGSFRNAGF